MQPAHQHAAVAPAKHPLVLLTDGKEWQVDEPTTKYGDCRWHGCKSALMDLPRPEPEMLAKDPKQIVLEEALAYLELFKREKNVPEAAHLERVAQVQKEIQEKGTYVQTYEELSYGAKVAWRNSGRCINRIQWSNIEVRDCRNLTTGEEIFRAICDHIKFAWNGGKLISTMSVFPIGVIFFSPQFFRYAAYRMPDGSIKGDPSNLELTQYVQKLGWSGPGTAYDMLPIVFDVPGEGVSVCEIPKELQYQVNIEHPTIPAFNELGIKWSAIPVIANMSIDQGGIKYTATPFSGWFMNTEIGSRNLLDAQRYNLSAQIAEKMGLDTTSTGNLWRERVMVETNVAVLNSFRESRVSMVDHNTAAEGFMMFYDKEIKTRGKCPADWVWIVPPVGGSVSPLFHLEMINYIEKPMYYNLPPHPWRAVPASAISFRSLAMSLAKYRALLKFVRKFARSSVVIPILFASETGRSEMFAQALAAKVARIKGFKPVLHCMDNVDFDHIFARYQQVFIITSTFGNGNAPRNGVKLEEWLKAETGDMLTTKTKYFNLYYSVFALGSRAYEKYCGFGRFVNDALGALGGIECLPIGEGDELAGQERAFNKWANEVCKLLGSGSKIASKKEAALPRAEATFLEAGAEVHHVGRHDFSAPISVTNPLPIKVISNEIFADKQGDEKILIKFEIPTSGLQFQPSYEPGDHLVVFPENPPAMVEHFLHRLGLTEKADAPLTVAVSEEVAALAVGKLPKVFTLRDAFLNYFDLQKLPEKDLLKLLYPGVNNDKEKKLIEVLLAEEKTFNQWKDETAPSVFDLFVKFFPTAAVPELSLLLPQLDVMQPRSYSIASAQSAVGSQVDLLVSALVYKPPHAPQKTGLCSTFLKAKKAGELVRVSFRKAEQFRLPINHETRTLSAPVVMVAAGSGLAPFRGFLQEVSKLKAVNEKVGLFYGCRFNDSFVCREEVADFHGKGVISHLQVACSREGQKLYVQHLLQQQANYVWDEIIQKNGKIYVCGDLNMSNGVTDSLINVIVEKGQTDVAGAKALIHKLTTEKRIVEDIFGLVHKPDIVYHEGHRALWAH